MEEASEKVLVRYILEPHHPDILDFLQMKKPNGLEEHRARDLFYAVYLSDLFMERVKDDQMWSLIDPNECPALQDAVGDRTGRCTNNSKRKIELSRAFEHVNYGLISWMRKPRLGLLISFIRTLAISKAINRTLGRYDRPIFVFHPTR